MYMRYASDYLRVCLRFGRGAHTHTNTHTQHTCGQVKYCFCCVPRLVHIAQRLSPRRRRLRRRRHLGTLVLRAYRIIYDTATLWGWRCVGQTGGLIRWCVCVRVCVQPLDNVQSQSHCCDMSVCVCACVCSQDDAVVFHQGQGV